MPIFEYACNQCGHEFETLVRASTVADCPSCHSTDLAKKLSVSAHKFSASAQAKIEAAGGSVTVIGSTSSDA